jgi:hypothetical protein
MRLLGLNKYRLFTAHGMSSVRTSRCAHGGGPRPHLIVQCRGLIFEGCHRETHCLKLLKNLYGQKQAGRVWHEYLVEGLIERHFKQSIVDNCVFYKGSTMLLVYVDDAIICGPSSRVIDEIIASLKKDYDVTDEGEIDDYLGAKSASN